MWNQSPREESNSKSMAWNFRVKHAPTSYNLSTYVRLYTIRKQSGKIQQYPILSLFGKLVHSLDGFGVLGDYQSYSPSNQFSSFFFLIGVGESASLFVFSSRLEMRPPATLVQESSRDVEWVSESSPPHCKLQVWIYHYWLVGYSNQLGKRRGGEDIM